MNLNVDPTGFFIKVIGQTSLSALNFLTKKKPLGEGVWLPRIQKYFDGKDSIIHGVYSRLPIVKTNDDKTIALTKTQESNIEKERQKIADHPTHSNDPHLILEPEYIPNWEGNPVIFKTIPADYATVRVLKSSDMPIKTLSAGALLLCEENKSLILHKRSEDSDTYPNYYHLVGGSYMPKTAQTMRYNDGGSLKKTAIREIWEELGIISVNLDPCTMLMQEEPDTGFIQLCFLGASVSKDQLSKIDENYEGEFQEVEFNHLAKLLNDDERLVPTCKSAILSWLALDTPGTRISPTFGGMKPKQLFKKITSA